MVGWGLFEYYREKVEKLKAEREAAVEHPKTTSAIGSMEWRASATKARTISRVTIIQSGPQLMTREDRDVAEEMQRILSDEGIQILVVAETLNVNGRSGEEVGLTVRTPSGEQQIEGSDIAVGTGRVPNTAGIALEQARRRVGHPWLHSRQ